jgi:hypothetical protein
MKTRKNFTLVAVIAIYGIIAGLTGCSQPAEVPTGGKTLVSIAVTTAPTKTDYTIGESLNLDGLVVTATYSDNTTEPVTGYTPSGFDSSSPGSKIVTVTYKDKTSTFTVMVNPAGKTLTGIAVTTQPAKTSYAIGEPLNLDGLVVTATYSDNSTDTITGYTTSGFNSSSAGSKTVTVNYGGKSATFTVTVNADGSQTPTADDYTIGNLSQTAGDVTAVTIVPATAGVGAVITIRYDNDTAIPQEAGTYAVTFDVEAATGWNAVNGLSAGDLIVNAVTADTDYTITGSPQVYDGSPKAISIEPKSGASNGERTIFYEGTDDTTYTKTETPPTNAGTYTVTFDVAAAPGFNEAIGLSAGTLTINAADPGVWDYDITGTGTSTYNGSAREVTVTPYTGKSSGTPTIYYEGTGGITYTITTDAPSDAGSYTVTFNVAASADGNWKAANGLSAGTITINKASGDAVGAPELDEKTSNSITVKPVIAANGQPVEYVINTNDYTPAYDSYWQSSPTFTGLNAATSYYIFARAVENNNYTRGAASGSLPVTTLSSASQNQIVGFYIIQINISSL